MTSTDASVIWHEAECGSYGADLELWEELAEEMGGTILDLGCGTGRVALHLARRGHRMIGMDLEPAFVDALSASAGELPIETLIGDAREFDLDAKFSLVLAPMQLLQLFGDANQRARCLHCAADHLAPGGVAAFAIVESMPKAIDAPPLLPDTREVDGWVYSSLPVDVALDSGEIRIRRLRQTVSPSGALSEELDEVLLHSLDAAALESEAEDVGLRAAGRRPIPATEEHVGSTVVLLTRGGD